MHIRIGYCLTYEFVQPTPLIAVLNVHHSRSADLVTPDIMKTTPTTPVSLYRDSFGNLCNRLVAPAGRFEITADAVISRSAGYALLTLGLAGLDPDRGLDGSALVLERDHVGLVAQGVLGQGKAEALGELRAHYRHVVPGQLGEGLGQLLKPAVVREAPVPDARIRAKHELELRSRNRLRRAGPLPRALPNDRNRSCTGPAKHD